VLEEFCRRVKAVSLDPTRQMVGHGGTTMGLDVLPITIERVA